ncbi:hypothetical protein ACJQWK_00188 [Exserohilum turcicum]|uniref:F-box domain-containing protein n=1 Tax=Exserohilum turcicum (strain 28A) TaxID=671987 RepID=R0K4E3_EXST2|nr:uncharacterized protein SETTUDRAFT_43070 [Exserohilum turcica Et28A]EOA83197.1 hypothetical protein SETTUDRAFT_43070 [Exserohilum turcica Et28A]
MATELISTPGFSDLPNELVMNIIECMPIEAPKDICNFSLTSRRMHMLALDHLYNHVLVSCPWPLVRTLLNDPELAARVHQVTWKPDTDEDYSSQNQKMLSSLLKSFKPVGLKRWSSKKQEPAVTWRHHEFMNFFLMSTPIVATLVIKDTHGWRDNVYWFGGNVSETGKLQHLRSVHIHGPLCMEQTAHLFLLPSLRDITLIDLVQLERRTRDYVEWEKTIPLQTVLGPHMVSHVQNITLKRASVETQTLAYFTQACKDLKSFAYEHDVHNDLRNLHSPNLLAKMQTLASALTRNRASLERLSIRGDHQMLLQKHVLQVARLASGMSVLRSLDMGLVTHDDDPERCTPDFVMELVRLLPPTLEELTIEMDWQEHWGSKGWEGPTDMLRYFADIAPEKLQSLRRVAVVDWPPKLGCFPPDFAVLYQCFAEHGVHFASIPANIEGPDPLQMSDCIEPGWVFVMATDVEWHY